MKGSVAKAPLTTQQERWPPTLAQVVLWRVTKFGIQICARQHFWRNIDITPIHLLPNQQLRSLYFLKTTNSAANRRLSLSLQGASAPSISNQSSVLLYSCSLQRDLSLAAGSCRRIASRPFLLRGRPPKEKLSMMTIAKVVSLQGTPSWLSTSIAFRG